ncbi:hypothetical protein A0H81_01297 [Grifola frondosa]|uniref:CCAAT-binding factor domain-containing protein n=1 Tax=Grifola frondosa TaxID=5627 RepID=A0A1C7MV74_GRIFR|nr:hypothetical protein A0H81_01297 [Grifola frondosa]
MMIFDGSSYEMLPNYSFQVSPHVPGNLLSILERLTTFPTKASELNAWWVEELGTRPPTKKHSDPEDEPVEHDADVPSETEDDWRKFFEDQPTDTEQTPVGGGPRLHTMTIHQSLHSLASHKAIFTRAWLGLLPQLSLDTGESNRALSLRVLNVLHRGVLPHLTRPILVMDWVSSAVDHGGTVGLLALNALFVLMKEYNLDYPSFYTRLYGFLDRNVLHLKHRARFFRLTELFLSSTLIPMPSSHLPAILVASFVKRLARLSLNAPPAAVVMIMPFTYNILRTHPSLMCMIHRDDDLLDVHCDAFLVNEPNPNLTKALDSSLWELYTHKIHFHAAVSTLARIFEEAFTRPQYNMEDFLDHTYGTMFETETKHKIRKDPVVVEEPSHEFTHDQFWMYS